MLHTKKMEREFRRLDRRSSSGLVRAAGRRITFTVVLGIALGTLVLGMLMMAFEPLRAVWDWVQGVGQRVEQIIMPADELVMEAELVFAANFTDNSLVGEASADITAENLRAERVGDLFGLGQSSQSIDQAIATVRWLVYWQDAQLSENVGQLTVRLPQARFGGVWILAEDLPMPIYDANWMARLSDVFNGIDDPDALRGHLVEVLNEEAAKHGPDLKARAEAAATRTITELLAEQGLTAQVVFDG